MPTEELAQPPAGDIPRALRKIVGIAVSIGARISSLAGPGEVLVSRAVRDLVAGSRLSFEERGSGSSRESPMPGTRSR